MKQQSYGQRGTSVILAAVVAVVVIGLGAIGWLVYEHNRPQATGATGGTQTTNQNKGQQTTTTPPTTVTYTSSKEHASFQYPNTWTVAKPLQTSNDSSNTDQVGLTSPTGAITISYTTDISGFGNEHTASYPYNTVVNKTALAGAPGLYVVSGTTTLDGTTYYPWIAVQDSNGILSTGVQGNVVTFRARHALNASTGSLTGILFATSGARTTQNSPALTQAQATAWFAGAEAQQAKQILLSFTDAQ